MLAILFTALCIADDPVGDLKKMEGEWTVASMESQGQVYSAEQIKHIRLKIEGDQFIFSHGETSFTTKATHFDSVALPKAIDLTRDHDDQTIKGIYKLDGDTLTICTASRGDRPTDFSAGPDNPNQLRVYKRAKPGK